MSEGIVAPAVLPPTISRHLQSHLTSEQKRGMKDRPALWREKNSRKRPTERLMYQKALEDL
jgi:hypothetical protein